MAINNEQQEFYSPWVGLVYVFNLIVGTGALTLPAVFQGAGWLLSSFLILTLAFVGFVTVTFVVESMACANASLVFTKLQSRKIDSDSEGDVTEQTAIISRSRSRYYTLNQRIELGQISTMYFNRAGRTLFFISLCVYLYGDLSIYVAAVSKTLSDLVCNRTANNIDGENFDTLCWDSAQINKMDVYRIFVGLFATLVAPFAFFNIQKTKYLQMFTSCTRWGAFLIMIAVASFRIYQGGAAGAPSVARISGIPALIGASVYSFMCHHSLPGLIAPFANKQHVVRQLGLDYLLICSFYLLLAITGSFAFDNIFDLYTLNFVPTNLNVTGICMEIVEYFLALFPVFSLSMSFPIIAITLQNNLKCLFLDVNVIDTYGFLRRRILFPFLTITPPIIVALLTHNLKTLVEFTGLYAGTAIEYVFPSFMVWCARKHCVRAIGGTNRYASPFKGRIWLVLVLFWSASSIILVTVNLFRS